MEKSAHPTLVFNYEQFLQRNAYSHEKICQLKPQHYSYLCFMTGNLNDLLILQLPLVHPLLFLIQTSTLKDINVAFSKLIAFILSKDWKTFQQYLLQYLQAISLANFFLPLNQHLNQSKFNLKNAHSYSFSLRYLAIFLTYYCVLI